MKNFDKKQQFKKSHNHNNQYRKHELFTRTSITDEMLKRLGPLKEEPSKTWTDVK